MTSDRQRPDAAAFERDMRARFVTRENLEKLFRLVMPHLLPDRPSLVYILTQSDRIGHLTMEPQVLKTLYGDRYDRIVVLTPPMTRPGANARVPECLGDGFVWVETDDAVIAAMGFVDGGLADLKRFHLLLQSPRLLFLEFWRHVVAGVRPAVLTLSDAVREQGRAQLRSIGIDPDAPYAFFHIRTMRYLEGLAHHGHRTAPIDSYAPSIRRILDAGYQVVRIGEAGVEPPGWPSGSKGEGYASLPDALPGLAPRERAVDLTVLAEAAFGTAQNSGPIWVAAAFGTPVLRTNTPFEHLNLPYNRDLSLFKRYRDRATGRVLRYAEILDAGLPALFRDADFDARGIELVANDADEIDAATAEFLAMCEGGAPRLADAARRRFLELGAGYERTIRDNPELRRENLDFYGYAHPFGDVAAAVLDGAPGFLD